MRPFLSYYGAKWMIAKRYPAPKYPTIIEPFAGSAGYSVRHHARQVILTDLSPRVAAVWSYLIRATPADILALPLLEAGQTVADLPVCPEARDLIGWWVNRAQPTPCTMFSSWAKDSRYTHLFWGDMIRARIAGQVDRIKHWKVSCGSYQDIAPTEATWFVDPPYSGPAGRKYPGPDIDYADLGAWCKDLPGQVIVCEQDGADWLPFQPLGESLSMLGRRDPSRRSHEAVWVSG